MRQKTKIKTLVKSKEDKSKDITSNLFSDIQNIIESAKTHVANYTNSALVMLNWQIGNRINIEILKDSRADYGEKIVKNLSNELNTIYGKGFDARALFRMVRFSKFYPDEKIVATLSPLLSWSKFVEILAIDDPTKRDFYTEMCRIENWSVRELRNFFIYSI